MRVANNVHKLRCKKSEFETYRPLVGPIETQGSCTAAATKSQGAHACYSSDVSGVARHTYARVYGILWVIEKSKHTITSGG